jgi:transglutaminase-like putative cysteine protease
MRNVILSALVLLLSACASNEYPPYSWQSDLHHRLLCDFNKTPDEVKAYISRYIPDVTDSQVADWQASGALESMNIDGETRFFHNAASNLFRTDSVCLAVKQAVEGNALSGAQRDDSTNIRQIMRAVADMPAGASPLACPKRMRVTYTLTVKADAVPAGQVVRCWLPFPRTDVVRQQSVSLLSTSEHKYRRPPSGAVHSTLYMEKKAVAGQPTVFSETFEYTSYGAKYPITAANCGSYNRSAALYKQFTAPRKRHIVFSPRLRNLAASITMGETNPFKQAQLIFLWINGNFPWASAREYSTIDNIPEYVLDHRHGDCGQVSLLFITLCRICGIPARFESGFMMHPHEQNLHDWAEVYFQNFGWVPVDQSFGVPAYAFNPDEKLFFCGGIDSWRMVVNSDFGRRLFPAKKFPRSETVDFQRGEVEWAGGNLYFDDWSYNLDVKYL